jgi:hypothetical protein
MFIFKSRVVVGEVIVKSSISEDEIWHEDILISERQSYYSRGYIKEEIIDRSVI